jgi:hypothetical protein
MKACAQDKHTIHMPPKYRSGMVHHTRAQDVADTHFDGRASQ